MKKTVLLAAALLSASTAFAGTVTSAVSAIASSNYAASYDIGYAINQAGLSTGYVSGVTDFDTYLAGNPIHTNIAGGYEWFTASGVQSASVTFDLGSVLSLSSIAVWAEEAWGPMSNVSFLGSTDGITFTTLLSGLSFADNNSVYPATRYDFSAANARYITMDVGTCGSSGCSLGEIAFNASTASTVPEPSSLALLGLGLGLGLIGFGARKAKSA